MNEIEFLLLLLIVSYFSFVIGYGLGRKRSEKTEVKT